MLTDFVILYNSCDFYAILDLILCLRYISSMCAYVYVYIYTYIQRIILQHTVTQC